MLNRNFFALLVVLGLFVISCERKASLDSDKAKYSYAIGHQIGRNIKTQSIELDVKAFGQAVEDQLNDKPSQLSDQEIQEALRKMADSRNEALKAEAEANKQKGETFLEENKKKEGVVVTKSGLQYKVVEKGKGKNPKKDDVVKVHYKGTLNDGTEIDSSYKRNQPAEFKVKAVITGWTEALQLMKEGAKWQLFIPADLAYGSRGNPTIPGNSVLVFDVELLEVLKK